MINIKGAHRVREDDAGHIVDGHRAGQPRGQLTETLQPPGHLGRLGGDGQHAGHQPVLAADDGMPPGEPRLLAPRQMNLRLRLEERPPAAEDVVDHAAHARRQPDPAEHLTRGPAQRLRMLGADQGRVRVVVDQQEIRTPGEHHGYG
jgi:hypothetical protein